MAPDDHPTLTMEVEEGGARDRATLDPSDQGRAAKHIATVRDLLERFGLIVAGAVLFVVFSLWLPTTFATIPNIQALINSQALILILGLGVTIVLRSGEFDLSIAAVMTLMGAFATVLIRDGTSLVLVFGIAIAFGLMVGVINGILVVRVGVSSFVATLGMMTLLGGLAYAVTDTQVIFGLTSPVVTLARHEILGFPLLTWYGWILAICLWYAYERTPVGRYILFVGGSPDSARLAGLNVDRIRIMSFVATSVTSSLAGILLAGYLGGIDPSVGPGYLLPPFVGAFLGATTISVGRFNALGTVVALYVLAIAVTGLQLLGAQPWVTDVFQGAALVVAVALARLVARRPS